MKAARQSLSRNFQPNLRSSWSNRALSKPIGYPELEKRLYWTTTSAGLAENYERAIAGLLSYVLKPFKDSPTTPDSATTKIVTPFNTCMALHADED